MNYIQIENHVKDNIFWLLPELDEDLPQHKLIFFQTFFKLCLGCSKIKPPAICPNCFHLNEFPEPIGRVDCLWTCWNCYIEYGSACSSCMHFQHLDHCIRLQAMRTCFDNQIAACWEFKDDDYLPNYVENSMERFRQLNLFVIGRIAIIVAAYDDYDAENHCEECLALIVAKSKRKS